MIGGGNDRSKKEKGQMMAHSVTPVSVRVLQLCLLVRNLRQRKLTTSRVHWLRYRSWSTMNIKHYIDSWDSPG